MPTEQDKMVMVFDALTACLARSSKAQYEALIRGRAHLKIEMDLEDAPTQRTKGKPKLEKKPLNEADMNEISRQLASALNVDAGLDVLLSMELNRRDLETLSRWFELPARKEDSVERLRERIVGATVGARLNSKAIRGD